VALCCYNGRAGQTMGVDTEWVAQKEYLIFPERVEKYKEQCWT
jgi:hypothetical protein